MAVEIRWDTTTGCIQRILITRYIGEWTYAEFERAITPFLSLTSPDSGSYVLIHDLSRQAFMPLEVFSEAEGLFLAEKPRFSTQIVVGANVATVTLFQLFKGAMPDISAGFSLAETMEIALDRARQIISVGASS